MLRVVPFCIALATAFAACIPNLSIPDGALISCATDAECPTDQKRICLRRTASALGECVLLVVNESPSVAIEPIARVTGETVSFALTITDLERDPVTTKLSVVVPGFEAIPLAERVLESEASGVRHVIEWTVSGGLPDRSYRDGLVLEVTTNDATSASSTTRSAPFAFGNDAPTITGLSVDDGVARGLAIVRFTLADSTSDLASVQRFELSLAGDFSDVIFIPVAGGQGTHFPSGALTALATSPNGVPHSVTWDSRLAAPLDVTQARLRMVVSDEVGGQNTASAVVQSDPLSIDNAQSAPVVSIVSAPSGTVAGGALLAFDLADADGDLSAITVEYAIGSGPFTPASSASPSRLLAPGRHAFVWQTTQLPSGVYTDVVLRLSVSDGSGPGNSVTTAPFTVDTFAAATPVVTIDAVDGSGIGRALETLDVQFTLRDANSSLVDVTVDYMVSDAPGAPLWRSATAAVGSDVTGAVSTSPAGVVRHYRWDAVADARLSGKDLSETLVQVGPTGPTASVVAFTDNLFIRVGAVDDTLLTAVPAVFGPFSIGNNAPSSFVSEITSEQSAGVPVLFSVSDDASDVASVELEFRRSPSDAWRRCAILLGNEDGLVSSPSGVEHVVVWDSLAPVDADPAAPQGVGSRNPTQVQLRVRAIDRPRAGAAHYGPWYEQLGTFAIRNQRPPQIEAVNVTRTDALAGGGMIDIHYTLIDPDSDAADMRFELSFDQGTTWEPCPELSYSISEGRYDLATAPTGVEHLYLCDTSGLTLLREAAARIRLIASDGLSTPSTPYEVPLVKVPIPTAATPNVRPMVDTWSVTLTQSALGLAVADLNGDRANDLAIGDGANVKLFIQTTTNGAGNGGFAAGPVLASANAVYRIKTADLNNDAVQDLVVCSSRFARVFVSVPAMPGQFTTGPSFDYNPDICWDIDAADVNRDGIMDLVVLKYGGDVLVYQGGGTGGVWDGSFTLVTTRSTAFGSFMTVADLNGDLDPDIAVAASTNLTEGTVELVLGNGTFTLPAPVSVVSAPGTRHIASADVDNDGDLDLIVTCALDAKIGVHKNNGSGTFSAPTFYPARGDARGLAAGDFNADGYVDVVTTHLTDSSYVVLLNTGNGGFRAPARFGIVGPLIETVAAGDLDADGVDDVAYAESAAVKVTSSRAHTSESYFASPLILTTLGNADAPLAADFNSDGVPDIVTASAPTFGSGGVGVFLGNGLHGQARGTFGSEQRYFTSSGTIDTRIGDFNGDGILDIATVNPYGSSYTLLAGLGSDGFGDGTFSVNAFASTTQNLDGAITAGDFNNDGVIDFAGAVASSVIAVLPGTPSGSFGTALSYDFGAFVFKLEAADLDGDGNVDLIASTNAVGSHLRFAFGRGDFTFDAPVVQGVPGIQGRALLLADLNNDGGYEALSGAQSVLSPSPVWLFSDLSRDGIRNANGLEATPLAGYNVGYPPVGAAAGDFNRDGVADVVVPSSLAGATQLHLLELTHTGGVSDLSIARSAIFQAESDPRELSAFDLNQDGNVDLAVANNASRSVSVHLGQYEGIHSQRQALGALSAKSDTRVRVTRANVLPGGVDRFGATKQHPFMAMSLLPAGSDGEQFLTALRRAKPFVLPATLQPLTHTYQLRGDKRLTRVSLPAKGGTRVRIENRFGARTSVSDADFDRDGLTVPGGALATQAGLVVRLPILQARSNEAIATATSVRVVARFYDWRRAASLPSDPLNTPAYQPGVDDPVLAPARYLPCRATAGVCTKTLVKLTSQWVNVPRVSDLALGSGPRFIIEGRNVVILTDQGGDFQAFLEP